MIGSGPRMFLCTCGKAVQGNLAKASHRRACDGRYWSDNAAYEMRVFSCEVEAGRIRAMNERSEDG